MTPAIPVWSNVDAKPHTDPAEIRDLLVRQVLSPVRWEEAMRGLLESGVERFYEIGRTENGLVMLPDGPIKTFTLRGIKDSPPYLHDGRLPTLADTVEFFNLVLRLRLTQQEKDSLVAYMLAL